MPYYNNKTLEYLKLISEKIRASIYENIDELSATAWVTEEPVSFQKRLCGEKKEVKIGDRWGELWDCAWFCFKGRVPKQAVGKKIVLLIELSGEGCVFDADGCPVQGLTNVRYPEDYGDGRKRVVNFLEKSQGGEEIELWAEAGCNDLFGVYRNNGTLAEAYISVCNEEMKQLYYDYMVLYILMETLPKDSARYYSILFALNEASKAMSEYTEEEAVHARTLLSSELHKKGGDPSLSVSAIGHAHIDLAWLWPIRETIRKGSRTFSTVLMMMERYPDYIFGASQPQMYQWMKERYPKLYGKIKERVSEGRWEPQGAMWVEPDTNISGGESLIRQIIYGKNFFREEFGVDTKILWLPDVFGYTAALPQILKKSGVDYFMTIKLSWSEHNIFPHHTFNWEGIDGSKVLVHMPPEGTYNSLAVPASIKDAERKFIDKGVSDYCMTLFGIGDGGGGPGEEHLEALRREKNLQGLPPVTQEKSIDFFKKIEKNSERYNTWKGELYLEKHQGTYTTQARNKYYNRKMEVALRELEFVSVLAMINCGYCYPKEELDTIWKEILLYQFHDILPGSSIKRVYDESLERYEKLLRYTMKMTSDVCSSMIEEICTDIDSHYIVTNSLSWDRHQWISINGSWKYVTVPSMGISFVHTENFNEVEMKSHVAGCFIENDLIKVKFSDNGTIISIFDKENDREVIANGDECNRLALYDDVGDAWDIPINYDELPGKALKLKSATKYVDGPCAISEHTYETGKSKIVQKVVLTQGSRRIDFKTKVDWHEKHKMLRTSFAVDVYADEATCNIQFGSIKRPTHRNTSWDMAKFEICAHKWIDISQVDYGVALMNDCKYGHKVLENIMDINLLRSTDYPGEDADMGMHEFIYSLYPHKGNCIEGNVIQNAYELNIPLNVVKLEAKSGKLNESRSFIKVEPQNIIIETVKKAEKDDSVIIRLYECCGASVKGHIFFNFPVKSVQMVDMMEENHCHMEMENNKVNIKFKPFEIHTLKVFID